MKTLPICILVCVLFSCTEEIIVKEVSVEYDTVYVDPDTVFIDADTVFIDSIIVVDSRLTIIHPGLNNYEGIYHWNDAITEWLDRVNKAGLKPKATTVVFTPIHWGNPSFGSSVYLEKDSSYLVYMEFYDTAAIWRALSYTLLDIPFIEADSDDYGNGYWWEDEWGGAIKPEYDHLMFQFFDISSYENATSEKQDWYWEDMFSN